MNVWRPLKTWSQQESRWSLRWLCWCPGGRPRVRLMKGCKAVLEFYQINKLRPIKTSKSTRESLKSSMALLMSWRMPLWSADEDLPSARERKPVWNCCMSMQHFHIPCSNFASMGEIAASYSIYACLSAKLLHEMRKCCQYRNTDRHTHTQTHRRTISVFRPCESGDKALLVVGNTFKTI